MELKGIIEGFTNRIFGKEELEHIAQKRLEICSTCPSKRPFTCGECGCNLEASVRAYKNKKCPLGKWNYVKTDASGKVIIDDGLNGR